jgi:hypothetical protein
VKICSLFHYADLRLIGIICIDHRHLGPGYFFFNFINKMCIYNVYEPVWHASLWNKRLYELCPIFLILFDMLRCEINAFMNYAPFSFLTMYNIFLHWYIIVKIKSFEIKYLSIQTVFESKLSSCFAFSEHRHLGPGYFCEINAFMNYAPFS